MLNQGSLKSRLWKFRHVLAVLLSRPAVAEAFATYGIETQHILAYRQLFDRCLQAFYEAQNNRSSGLAVTDEIQAQIDQVKRMYRQHLTLARHVMTHRDDQARLELVGPRQASNLGWIYQARAFYLNMGEDQLARLARFKITPDRLDQVRLQLDTLESQLSAVHLSRMAQIRKTRERDDVFQEMAVAAADLEVVARVLSEDHPDLMNLLTREPRAGATRTSSTTEPLPDPASDQVPDSQDDEVFDTASQSSLELPVNPPEADETSLSASAERFADDLIPPLQVSPGASFSELASDHTGPGTEGSSAAITTSTATLSPDMSSVTHVESNASEQGQAKRAREKRQQRGRKRR